MAHQASAARLAKWVSSWGFWPAMKGTRRARPGRSSRSRSVTPPPTPVSSITSTSTSLSSQWRFRKPATSIVSWPVTLHTIRATAPCRCVTTVLSRPSLATSHATITGPSASSCRWAAAVADRSGTITSSRLSGNLPSTEPT